MDIDENAPGNKSQQEVTRTTDNETGHDPKRDEPEVSLPSDDEAPVDDDMTDENDQEPRGVPASDPESGA